MPPFPVKAVTVDGDIATAQLGKTNYGMRLELVRLGGEWFLG